MPAPPLTPNLLRLAAMLDPEPEPVPSWDGSPCPVCRGVSGRCTTDADGSASDCVAPPRRPLREKPYRVKHATPRVPIPEDADARFARAGAALAAILAAGRTGGDQ